MREKSRMRLEEQENDGEEMKSEKGLREAEAGVASQAEKPVSVYKRSPLSD